jgi:CheY-like chemotaxis protein
LQIILRKVLQNLNLLCDEAENGQVAVDLHRQGKTYDLVLMDKEMPVMDGHQVSEELSTVFFGVYHRVDVVRWRHMANGDTVVLH